MESIIIGIIVILIVGAIIINLIGFLFGLIAKYYMVILLIIAIIVALYYKDGMKAKNDEKLRKNQVTEVLNIFSEEI